MLLLVCGFSGLDYKLKHKVVSSSTLDLLVLSQEIILGALYPFIYFIYILPDLDYSVICFIGRYTHTCYSEFSV